VDPRLRGSGLATRLIAAAEAEAETRGCSQTVHFTYDFQARALYERTGYELIGRVENFPSGADVLWFRKRLHPPEAPPLHRDSIPVTRRAGAFDLGLAEAEKEARSGS
jgi:Acetyltransferase (GNAT) family